MKYKKKLCPKCNQLIGVNNYSRHIVKCNGTYTPKNERQFYKLDHDDLFCKFCNKEFKNKNALVQHELRCRNNPKRVDFNNFSNYIRNYRKGKTKETSTDVAKQVTTVKNKYANGYISPLRGRKVAFEYIHQTHNDDEIDKWRNYTKIKNVIIPQYEISSYGKNNAYCIIKKSSLKNNNIEFRFEHDYIADLYLDGALSCKNTVHHIDKNTKNNNISNLLVFETFNDHKRFHNSKYAYLIYNEQTHLFSCKLVKT